MPSVAKLYNVPEVLGALVGLELEVEGTNLPEVRGPWITKPDGSLRNGLEYVFREPLGSVKSKEALEVLQKQFEASGARLDYSFRCSTHVHVNVSNLDLEVVKTMVGLFTLFEDEYINFCDRGRKGNRFCLRAKDADGVVNILARFVADGSVPDENRGKYSAMNLCTLKRYGTLEFRTLEGTNDWNRIFTWVRALLALRKTAKDLGTLKAVVDMPVDELSKMLFPTARLREVFLKEGWEQRVEYSRSVCWDVFAKVKL